MVAEEEAGMTATLLERPPTSTRSVLCTAAEIVEAGWLQRGWYVREPTPLRRMLRSKPPRPDQVRQSCLVAAIAVAAHRGTFLVNLERDALPFIDQVWRVLHPGQIPYRFTPRQRIRSLVEWNDQPGRTRQDVVAVLRAADRWS